MCIFRESKNPGALHGVLAKTSYKIHMYNHKLINFRNCEQQIIADN